MIKRPKAIYKNRWDKMCAVDSILSKAVEMEYTWTLLKLSKKINVSQSGIRSLLAKMDSVGVVFCYDDNEIGRCKNREIRYLNEGLQLEGEE